MSELLHVFFTSGSFIPHGNCYLWKPGLVWLHLLSDTLIALACYSIALTLLYFAQKRQDLPFNSIFLLISAFTVASGTTHLMGVWTLWHPIYWLSGTLKAITALVSFYTAVMLVPLVSQALALPSSAQLEATNQELQEQIKERQRVEEALRESERRFRAIFDQTFQFIGLLKPDGTLLEVNQTALKFGGLEHADVIGRPFWETRWWTISQTTQNRLKAAIAQAASGQFVRYEVDLQGAEDTQATVDFSLKPVFDQTEQVVLIISEGRDISERQAALRERKQAERALRKAHSDLEMRVAQRTKELFESNQALQAEIAERRRVEATLKETTTLQQAILDSANYTIISTTVDGTICTFNAAAQRWLGYSAAEVVDKTTPVIIHDQNEIVQRAHELSQELGVTIEPGFEVFFARARREEVDEQEWSYIRKDGSHFPVMLSITALRDAENNITGFLSIGSDISEQQAAVLARKQVEEALRQSERRYATLAQAAPVGIFRTNAEGNCLYVNEGWSEITGLTLEEASDQGWARALHPNDRERVFQEWYQAAKQKLSFKSEYQFLRPDGVTTWVFGQAVAEKGSDGEVTGYIGTITDISERKRAEEELRHLSKALESAVEGISLLDKQGCYISVNPAYASMAGYQPEELIGMNWELTVHPDDRQKLIAAYQNMLNQGKVEAEAKAVRKDGSVFDKQIVMIKAYDQQQQFIGHHCFMKDISDRREVERLKDEFVSIVSHELRTPLTSISGALDLLASGVLQSQPEDAQRMLNIATNNTERLVRLINDILDIERIESGKVQMSKQIYDLADLMNQSAEMIEEMANKAGVKLSVSLLEAGIWADGDRIIQVLTNLLSNAIKFSSPGSTVWLSAEIVSGDWGLGSGELVISPPASPAPPTSPTPYSLLPTPHLLIKVKDTGRGIPADKIESIFERFQQVDASDSRQKGGTGLGLAICRSILQHHGGQIWAESTLGEGSTFLFTLPMLLESTDEPAIISDSDAPLILECDDNPDIQAVVQTMLEAQGYRVLAVSSGQEAIYQAARQHPAVILLNLIMPGMDGWETLAILKQQTATQNIPIIILSGLSPVPGQALPSGVSDWIVKPPTLQLLCQALETVLAKQNQNIKVLIVEDDLDLAEVLITMFHRHGIETLHAQTGRQAIQISQHFVPDLLVLDLRLQESDGFTVVDWLRQHNRLCRIPLVVYTAQDLAQCDRERLKLGQTLFLTKGRINPQEFEHRVINLLNRMIRDS